MGIFCCNIVLQSQTDQILLNKKFEKISSQFDSDFSLVAKLLTSFSKHVDRLPKIMSSFNAKSHLGCYPVIPLGMLSSEATAENGKNKSLLPSVSFLAEFSQGGDQKNMSY